MTPIPPEFDIGKQVYVKGHEDSGKRTIVQHYPSIDGGVRLNAPVPTGDIFVSWNIDALIPCTDEGIK